MEASQGDQRLLAWQKQGLYTLCGTATAVVWLPSSSLNYGGAVMGSNLSPRWKACHSSWQRRELRFGWIAGC